MRRFNCNQRRYSKAKCCKIDSALNPAEKKLTVGKIQYSGPLPALDTAPLLFRAFGAHLLSQRRSQIDATDYSKPITDAAYLKRR